MLKEFLQAMEELWVKGHGAQVIRPEGEPAHVYWMRKGDELARVEAEPQPRRHMANDLDTLVRLAADFTGADQTVAVWYDYRKVVALLDDANRRDRVELTLSLAWPFAKLLGMAAGRFDQKALLRLLRVDLAGCVSPALVQAVRKMKFRQASSTEREVQHGRASLGKQIEAELTGAETIPEEVLFALRVWEGMIGQPEVQVRCDLEIDAQNENFLLTPLPGQMQAAIRTAEMWLGEQLDLLVDALRSAETKDDESGRIHVYYGQP